MEYPIKHVLILKVAKELDVPESVVDAVVTHEVEGAKAAMMECNSIEFSGFGKFYFNEKRARRKLNRQMWMKEHLERLIGEADNQRKRAGYQLKLQKLISDMTLLKTKLKE